MLVYLRTKVQNIIEKTKCFEEKKNIFIFCSQKGTGIHKSYDFPQPYCGINYNNVATMISLT
ncbi:hypothetical protein ADJ77_06735 [Prevotella fusca JCM 17724]|uniref:Uncharacterized protein n=1 Tax=Prevotella fusca JCM 17724 TaxID=1236517 RepID=A0A0K1NK47_9BACT|nr:hypothetical protein ADJ77_06735 [Prevotella fusca JCM 17724]